MSVTDIFALNVYQEGRATAGTTRLFELAPSQKGLKSDAYQQP